ncbi:MAG: hypothetical protein ACYDGN_10990 [Acidimicrobiales bacterium]
MATCQICGGAEHPGSVQCHELSAAPPPVSWSVIASTGPVVFAESPSEYAVYDEQRTYGRWPRTSDGYQFAGETYAAHAQSLAHGMAYAITGYQDPARIGLPTEPVLKSQTYAAPLSFVGSTRRLIAWAAKTSERSPVYAGAAWIVAIGTMMFAWAFILCWYAAIFGLFGVFVIPFRLMRRSSRKSLHVQRATLATQQAIYQQQLAAMQQQIGPLQIYQPPSGQSGPRGSQYPPAGQ